MKIEIGPWVLCSCLFFGSFFGSYAQGYEIDECTLKELNWAMLESIRVCDLYEIKSEEVEMLRSEVLLLDSLYGLAQQDLTLCEDNANRGRRVSRMGGPVRGKDLRARRRVGCGRTSVAQ